MNKNKLKTILEFNEKNKEIIESKVYTFRVDNGLLEGIIGLNFELFAKGIFESKNTNLYYLPVDNSEAGAFYIPLSSKTKYVFINTKKSTLENMFAIAHEIYHVVFGSSSERKCEIITTKYEDSDNEKIANAFAGNLLMPNAVFKREYEKTAEKYEEPKDKILYLMNYFNSTYMSVVIRCLELFRDEYNDEDIESLLKFNDPSLIRDRFVSLGLDSNILEPSKRNDSRRIITHIKNLSTQIISRQLVSQEILEYKLNEIYDAITLVTGIDITENGDVPISDTEEK